MKIILKCGKTFNISTKQANLVIDVLMEDSITDRFVRLSTKHMISGKMRFNKLIKLDEIVVIM
jgi:hypothetical protein